MNVSELHEELGRIVARGQGDLRVIASCRFELNGETYDRYMTNLESACYQSGDIELSFDETREEEE